MRKSDEMNDWQGSFMTRIKFNDKDIPSFLTITDISIPAFSTEKTRKISVDFTFKTKGLLSNEKIDELAAWLKGGDDEYSTLVLMNDTTSYYLAKVKDDVELKAKNQFKATGTITFECFNRISFVTKSEVFTTQKIINYNSEQPSPPMIKFTIKSECEEILLTFKNEKYDNFIHLISHFNVGETIRVDCKTLKVMTNNRLTMPILTLDSFFHNLVKGENRYELKKGNCDVEVSYREEYL